MATVGTSSRFGTPVDRFPARNLASPTSLTSSRMFVDDLFLRIAVASESSLPAVVGLRNEDRGELNAAVTARGIGVEVREGRGDGRGWGEMIG